MSYKVFHRQSHMFARGTGHICIGLNYFSACGVAISALAGDNVLV
jgi:hypothetical protein